MCPPTKAIARVFLNPLKCLKRLFTSRSPPMPGFGRSSRAQGKVALSPTVRGWGSPHQLFSPRAERARDPLSSLGRCGSHCTPEPEGAGPGAGSQAWVILFGDGCHRARGVPELEKPQPWASAGRVSLGLTCWAASARGRQPRAAARGPQRPAGRTAPSAPPS